MVIQYAIFPNVGGSLQELDRPSPRFFGKGLVESVSRQG